MEKRTLPERAGWRDEAQKLGFTFADMAGEPYWDETSAYRFTLHQIEQDLEAPATELHALCREAVDRAAPGHARSPMPHTPAEQVSVQIGKAAARVGHRATLRAQLLEHLRSVGGVRTLSELAEELGRDCTLLRADLDFLEAASLVWRRWWKRGAITLFTMRCKT